MSDPIFSSPVTNAFGLSDVGYSAKPTFADLNGDGDLDALVGNKFNSLAGNDTLIGGLGNDLLNGGTGIDTASCSAATPLPSTSTWQRHKTPSTPAPIP